MAESDQRNRDGTFRKGHKRFGGRGSKQIAPPEGTVNLKQASIAAMIAHGNNGKGAGGLQGCCDWLLRKSPRAYVMLMARLASVQDDAVAPSRHIGTINIRPIESGTYFRPEEIRAQLARPVDTDPVTIADAPSPPENVIPMPSTDDGPSAA